MVHSDNRGLVIPPKMAPTQVRIIPIQLHKEGVLDKAYELRDMLKDSFRVDVDAAKEKTPGFKFNEAEMLGIPVRIELGPRDIENGKVILVRRDTLEKEEVSFEKLKDRIAELMVQIQQDMYDRAKKSREERTSTVYNMDEFKKALEINPGFIRAMHCEDEECEAEIKAETAATIRCFPFNDKEPIADKCVCCGKPAKKLAYFARAY